MIVYCLFIIEKVDEIVVVEDGVIVECGMYNDLFEYCGVYV